MTKVKLRTDETERLSQIVASLWEFVGGITPRAKLVDLAGVGEIVPDLNLDGPAGDVAWDLVRRLRGYGWLPEPELPRVHALGSLLLYVLRRPDLPQDDAGYLANVVVRHKLAEDQALIDDLCSRFNITHDGDTGGTGLTDSQRKELHTALISAFPPHAALSHMVNQRLDEDLDAICGTGTLEERVTLLIDWAETQDKLDELIRKALAHNPRDPSLRLAAEQLLLSRPRSQPRPTSSRRARRSS